MREVAKSMVGLSWAVSIYSLQQLSKVMTPAASSAGASDATAIEVDDLSRVVQSRLSEAAAEQFRAVDQWQRRVIDAMFDAAAPLDPRGLVETLTPSALLDSADPRAMVESGVSLVQRGVGTAIETMRHTAESANDAARRIVDSVRPQG